MQMPAVADENIALTVDATGLRCPLPLLRMKVALAGLPTGSVLEVLATDPGSVEDFRAYARISGHEIIGFSESAKTFRYLIQKKG